jgi:histidinol-phosphate aminotransferase
MPPEYVLGLQPYVPGKPIEELERELGIKKSVKLASNENPIGPSPLALKTIKNSLKSAKSSSSLNRYPDGSGFYLKNALTEMLSKNPPIPPLLKGGQGGITYNVSPDEIILGNGSNELIDIAVKTFMKDADEAVMATPSFVVYFMAVQSVGGKSIQIPLKDYTHDLSAIADAITPKTKMIFIANPNNPTGTINKRAEFESLMEKVSEEMLIVIDEAYFEYVTDPDYPDSMKYLHSNKNVLILRTFSKIYGLAGLRLGYGIAKKEILTDMNRIREPFNTNSIAQKAAIAALKDIKHLKESRKINNAGKKYLYSELSSLGLKFVPTEANFIYMPVEDAKSIYEHLLKMGVIIRPMGPKAIRVTIGLPEENKKLIKSLRRVIGAG